MANTTWNPADVSNATLSGSNLVSTIGGGVGGARSAGSLNAGKFYWECTYTILNSNSISCGIALSTGSLTSPIAGVAYVARLTGDIIVNGTGTGSTLGQVPAGAVIGIAVDFSSQLLWMRRAPAGSWNGSGTADPATGVGGNSISAIAGPLFAYMSGQSGDRITANFGDGAFIGAIPSGFAAGFPAPTLNFSGVQDMSFVAGRSLVLGAGVVVPLPIGTDVSGVNPSFTMYSHMRLPGGTTYTFDNGVVHVVPATTDTVVAIPVSATSIVATAASTAQLGQSL